MVSPNNGNVAVSEGNVMKKVIRCVLLGVGAGILMLAATANAKSIAYKDVPEAVRQAVHHRFEDIRVVGAATERDEQHKLVYEVTLKDKGRNIDATFTPQGDIVTVENEIAAADLPKAVAATLERKYPKARYKMVEAVHKMSDGKEALAYYEVLLMDAKRQAWAVEVAADGAVVGVERKKGLREDED